MTKSMSNLAVGDAVELVCEMARKHLDLGRIEQAKRRQAAMFRWEGADYIPLLGGRSRVPALDAIPAYDWAEQFHSPAISFVCQMKQAVTIAAGKRDDIPTVRADTGVINGPCLFGAKYDVPSHTKPVVTEYVSKEILQDFELPDDIRGLGVVDRMVEHMEHHKATLEEHGLEGLVALSHCDNQGPFDIAEQTRGHDLLTDFYDDPEFVHKLMTQATRAYVALAKLCKEIAGDGPTRGSATGLWMEEGGVRMCDDSGILLSRGLYEEFVLPYHNEALAEFNGGWLHYCGGVPDGNRMEGLHLHDLYLNMPDLKAINFTTGKDLLLEVRKILAHKKCYFGTFYRGNDEPFEAYLRRVLSYCPGRLGLLWYPWAHNDAEEEMALDLWRKVQDEHFG